VTRIALKGSLDPLAVGLHERTCGLGPVARFGTFRFGIPPRRNRILHADGKVVTPLFRGQSGETKTGKARLDQANLRP
jgi:hypothetical protein